MHARSPHASDSAEQRRAESKMMGLLAERMGVELSPTTIAFDDGVRVEIDGADAARTVLVESWARIGAPKPAQRKKVLADALKLSWVASQLPTRPSRLIMLMADRVTAKPFTGGTSWAARAIADSGVEVVVVDLSRSEIDSIVAAQMRQYR